MFSVLVILLSCFFFQAEDGIRDWSVTGVQTCALPICGINRVVVPQDKQLPGSMRFRTVSHAEVVAAMLLRETFDVEALFLPLLGDYPRAAVGGSFRKAGRLRGHEPASKPEDSVDARLARDK